MNQQPDKLFRDKLQHYQKAAPISAWDKIAVAKEKKKRHSIWLKFAASLLLVAAVWTSVELTRSESPKDQLADTESSLAKTSSELNDRSNQEKQSATGLPPVAERATSSAAEIPASVGSGSQETIPANSSRKKTRNSQQPSATPAVGNLSNGLSTRSVGNPNGEHADTQTLSDPVANDNVNHVAESVVPENIITSNSVKLTYNIEDVSAYLEKNNDTDATEEEKKQSTLKKLLQKANDLKTNQDPFSELRQRKNEILALNFMNEKRGQKTRN